jgi:hypothetical protein
MFELYPVETLYRSSFSGPHKYMLLRLSVPVERNDLPAYIAITLGKSELDGGQFLRDQCLPLNLALNWRGGRILRQDKRAKQNA